MAHHWEEAGESTRAALWHRRAARWSGGRHPASTFEHWSRIRTLLENATETEDTLALGIEARAKLLLHAGRLGISPERQTSVFAEAEAMAKRSGSDLAYAMLLHHRSWVAVMKGAPDAALEAQELADRAGDAELRAVCRCAVAAKILWHGHEPLAGVEPLVAQVREITDNDPSVGAEMMGLSPLAFAAWLGAAATSARSFPDALRRYDYAESLARDFGDPLMVQTCAADRVMGWQRVALLGPAEARRFAALAIDIAEETGSVLGAVMAQWALGEALLLAEAFDEARVAMHRAAQHIEATGVLGPALAILRCRIAEAWLPSAPGKAREVLDQALAARVDSWRSPLFDLATARVLRASEGPGALDAADAALSNAGRLIEDTGVRGLSPAYHDERALWADCVGDRVEGARHRDNARKARARLGVH